MSNENGLSIIDLGMPRAMDTLGRVVIPSELRKIMKLDRGDEFAISTIKRDDISYLKISKPKKNDLLVRYVDSLGRIVVPKEVRQKHGISDTIIKKTYVDFSTFGTDSILIKIINKINDKNIRILKELSLLTESRVFIYKGDETFWDINKGNVEECIITEQEINILPYKIHKIVELNDGALSFYFIKKGYNDTDLELIKLTEAIFKAIN